MSRQVKEYRSFEHLMREGDYYPLTDPQSKGYFAYYFASSERDEFLVSFIEREDAGAGAVKKLKISEADAAKTYRDVYTGKTYTGEELKRGLIFTVSGERESAEILYLKEER